MVASNYCLRGSGVDDHGFGTARSGEIYLGTLYTWNWLRSFGWVPCAKCTLFADAPTVACFGFWIRSGCTQARLNPAHERSHSGIIGYVTLNIVPNSIPDYPHAIITWFSYLRLLLIRWKNWLYKTTWLDSDCVLGGRFCHFRQDHELHGHDIIKVAMSSHRQCHWGGCSCGRCGLIFLWALTFPMATAAAQPTIAFKDALLETFSAWPATFHLSFPLTALASTLVDGNALFH